MKLVDQFFRALDDQWGADKKEKITLPIIGSAALLLQTDYDRGTKDSDVLETPEISKDISAKLLLKAGKGSSLHKKFRMYLDIVESAIPFLPQKPVFHLIPRYKDLKHFRVETLDIVDVVVSKLKPFRAQDVSDIQFLAEQKLLSHERLISRVRQVLDYHSTDARSADMPKYIENLHVVERDMLFVPESKIELPDWI